MRENPIHKWMRTGDTPVSGNPWKPPCGKGKMPQTIPQKSLNGLNPSSNGRFIIGFPGGFNMFFTFLGFGILFRFGQAPGTPLAKKERTRFFNNESGHYDWLMITGVRNLMGT